MASRRAQLRALILRQRIKGKSATIDLPLPPSANTLFRNTEKGRARTKQYERWLAAGIAEILYQRIPLIPGEVQITVSIPKGGIDLDNALKASMDLLVKAYVIEDDSRIGRLTVGWANTQGRCVITIAEYLS